MVNLPGSILWLFLFVHLVCGQISDNIHKDTPSSDDGRNAINGTKTEDETGKKNAELEVEEEEGRFSVKPLLTSTTTTESPSKRRRVTYRTNAANVTDHPQMSPERRKSYLSIAERRRYYNRTNTQSKSSTQRDVLMYQETTNRPTVAHERMVLMNEIRESKQKAVNETQNQRVVVGTIKNETLPKTDNVTETVIYPHVEFGQKLRKTTTRGQDLRSEKSRRRKEKTKENIAVLNSTNKIGKGVQTQSTKLVKVDGSHWSTTKNPKTDVEAENFVMPWKGNKTSSEKTGKYIKSAEVATEKILPVPLSYDEVFATPGDITTTETDEVEITTNADVTTSRSTISVAPSTSTTTTTTTTPTTTTSTTTTTTTSTTTTTTSTTITTTPRPPYRKLYIPSVEYKSRFNYTRRPLYKNTTGYPVIRTTEKATKWRPSSTTAVTSESPSTESGSNTEEYPLTIEINENNKRVLSEMFRTTTESMLSSRTSRTTERTPKENEVVHGAPETTTKGPSSSSTTTEAEDFGEDHKPVGTSFNTKFYIIPNVTKTEVIKIVETEEDAENEVLVTAQTVGIAIYILAAFGLVPLLLALVFGAKFFVQRRRRKGDCDSDMRSDISGNDSHGRQCKASELKKSPSNVTTTTLVATTRLPRVHHWESHEKTGSKTWEFPRSKLKLLTILGQGNFGQVWKAEAEGMPGHEGLTRLVAVKSVKEGASEKEHGELIKELEIMQQIGSHPNIVTLLGCCTEHEPYYLIMEYVMYGKLLTYLREHRTNENYYNISNNNDALTSRDLTVFAYCVARGMEYLASKGIIHRDLAARNVLVDHNKLCKIADFGMSRSVKDSEDGQLYEERQHKGALPIRWMAPESLLYSLFTHKSDVWSFGIVLWEIVTLGSTPYPNMGAREVMRRVREGYRLERPTHCKHELYQLISHCWAHDPHKRPDFGELRRELANLLDDSSKDGIYVDLDSFAVSNRFHVSNVNKTNDFRLLERNEFKTLRQWEGQDWPMETRKVRSKRGKINGKGTVTLTGHGSFTVNSRILEKEFKLV